MNKQDLGHLIETLRNNVSDRTKTVFVDERGMEYIPFRIIDIGGIDFVEGIRVNYPGLKTVKIRLDDVRKHKSLRREQPSY